MATLRAFAYSDRGPVRQTNEDSYLAEDALGLLIVADGMGGHAAGEVASGLAVEAVAGFMRRTDGDTEFSWPYGIDPTLSLQANRLRTAIHLANRRVFRAAESHDDYLGMGTTIVAVLAWGNRAAIAHVGDSRVYLATASGLVQVTRDDSWAATVLGNGRDDAHAVAAHPMRHVLTNVLGARPEALVHVQERAVASGERLLLCSDGLHGVVDDETIRQVLARERGAEGAAAALVRTALERGTRDNVTVIVAGFEDA